jgi:hypothetical protein
MFCTCDRQTNERTNTAKLVSPLVHTHIFAEKIARLLSPRRVETDSESIGVEVRLVKYPNSQSNLYFTKSVASSTY